jgi:hypothetical protein
MGLDLKVMTSHFRERRGEVLSTASLRFDRDEGIFAQLMPDAVPCLVYPIPPGVVLGCYEDKGLMYTATDGRGTQLTYTTPEDLNRLRVDPGVAPWNRAILAFLLALPADSRVFLY